MVCNIYCTALNTLVNISDTSVFFVDEPLGARVLQVGNPRCSETYGSILYKKGVLYKTYTAQVVLGLFSY